MVSSTSSLVFKELAIDGFEKVVEVTDKESGLHAIIAIHDTRLGPAVGGTRAYPYKNFDDALTDVLRLSRGMTYKAAIAQTGTGGGKSVIITDGEKSEKLLLAFAEAVNAFEGEYICAEDIGMTLTDLGVVRKGTRYAVGLPHPMSSDDPSPYTVFGGFRGIQAACKHLWGCCSPKGRTVAIQGLGSTGMKLARSLFWAGAKLIVTDIDSAKCSQAAKKFGAEVVDPSEIYGVECDIFAPCAMGGIINPETIPQLKCKVVAGIANNQLLTDDDGMELKKRGILYAPDFVINGGGLYNVCAEIYKEGYSPTMARQQVDQIYDVLLQIYSLAKEKDQTTQQVALDLAEHNLDQGIGKRTEPITFHH